MLHRSKGRIIKAFALTIDVGVPLAATISQFPIWIERSSDSTVSGLFVLFTLLSFIPFWRQLKSLFHSPSAPMLWTLLFVVFLTLRSIIDEMLIIAFCGMISNVVGVGLYKLGQVFESKE